MKIFIVKSDAHLGVHDHYWAFLTSKRAQAKLLQLQQSFPASEPRLLSSVVLDDALPAPKAGTTLYIFESEADSETVFLCASTRAAAQAGLDNFCEGGSESYDLDHPLQVTVE